VLGQRVRAATICVTVILLFLMGILIGGIRVMDPPGWGAYGYMTQIILRSGVGGAELQRVEPASAEEEANPIGNDQRSVVQGSALLTQPQEEISDKPWFVGQILCGPITLAAAAVSVHEARPVEDPGASASTSGQVTNPQQHVPMSHARSWEIGTLYTAVAGMLNLLAIIDSTFRTAKTEEES
jgi:hypothetical protein